MIDADRFAQSRQVHDIQGLDRLRQSAQQNEEEALHEVAKQFEGMFVQMLIKGMRQATEAFELDSPFSSNYTKFYEQMGDQQMAQDLTQSGSFGLAELMVQQLRPDGDTVRPASTLRTDGSDQLFPQTQAVSPSLDPITESQSGVASGNSLPLAPYLRSDTHQKLMVEQQAASQHNPLDAIKAKLAASSVAITGAEPIAQSDKSDPNALDNSSDVADPKGFLQSVDFSSPQAFVDSVMPYAKKAADALGTSPAVLIAQAALETGWGQKAIRRGDGSSSNNLFNIKADQRWQGDSVSVNTLEYEQDLPVQRRAAFRAYDSVAESFNDFVDFLKKSSRYQPAIAEAKDSANFLHNLQQAGYATDPRYADKVLNVLKQVNSLL
ncbi:flagellar assembly peptidoglycan hydrolase FlgJ [Corallincola spongiicola]|uniref:Peptidoglycan hydrolase FlgJ n=1 Tax=Corallincola spongiicola TaxID=2520508 RepID=A0ABY1WKL3_9GAMM|nr:flagellar assembly peptidoglycan hydrolase FlgJ [Corallincola spongiicola]TAA40334.1 flagellar assembly peptidoglycan hydrolase FlgJ [Corallincola spongiicola]